MKTLKNVGKRAMALVLALMMCVGMLATTAFAENVTTCPKCGENTFKLTVSTKPTCVAIGTETRTCNNCWYTHTDTIPALGHEPESGTNIWSWSNDNTHTAQCARCHIWYNESHSFSAATCSAPQTCTVCHGTKGEKDLNNHVNLTTTTVAATCLNTGSETVTCECKTQISYTILDIDPSNHDADCHAESRGHNDTQHWVVLTCGVATNYQNHDFVGNVCNTCGYTKTTDPVTPPEHEHIWGEVQVEHPATCTSNATGKQDCTVAGCNASRDNVEVEGTMLAHNYTKFVSTTATCGAAGVATYQCATCTATREQPDAAKGHSFTNYVSNNDATCTADGTETAKCDRCDVTDTRTVENSKDPNKHTGTTGEGNQWKPVDDATHGKFCTDCGKQFVTGNHRFGNWVYNEAEQNWSRECRCGYVQTTADASAIHDCDDYWSEDFQPGDDGHVHVCTFPGCGNVSAVEAHEFGEWEVITAARPGVAGERAHTCGICGLTETDTIPALPDTGTGDGDGGDVVIDDTNPPLGGDPDGGDGEVELDDIGVPLAGPVTRAEFVDYLYRREGSPEAALSTFVDVPADHEYASAIGWGQVNDIAWGISETEFAPDELVTVEQVKLFLSRYAAFKGIEMPELAALVGLDDQDYAMNCDEILGEFFGADE